MRYQRRVTTTICILDKAARFETQGRSPFCHGIRQPRLGSYPTDVDVAYDDDDDGSRQRISKSRLRTKMNIKID